jgi:hypothetical protein
MFRQRLRPPATQRAQVLRNHGSFSSSILKTSSAADKHRNLGFPQHGVQCVADEDLAQDIVCVAAHQHEVQCPLFHDVLSGFCCTARTGKILRLHFMQI